MQKAEKTRSDCGVCQVAGTGGKLDVQKAEGQQMVCQFAKCSCFGKSVSQQAEGVMRCVGDLNDNRQYWFGLGSADVFLSYQWASKNRMVVYAEG